MSFAKIAELIEGRSYNDVKNRWSQISRQIAALKVERLRYSWALVGGEEGAVSPSYSACAFCVFHCAFSAVSWPFFCGYEL